MRQAKLYFLILCLVLLGNGCSDDTYQTNVPEVKFSLSLRFIHFPNLQIPGNYEIFNAIDQRFPSSRLGYRGLIIVHSYQGEYQCFDRACPNCPTYPKTSTPNELGHVRCPICGTEYDIHSFCFPINASKKGLKPLRRYKYIQASSDRLNIAN